MSGLLSMIDNALTNWLGLGSPATEITQRPTKPPEEIPLIALENGKEEEGERRKDTVVAVEAEQKAAPAENPTVVAMRQTNQQLADKLSAQKQQRRENEQLQAAMMYVSEEKRKQNRSFSRLGRDEPLMNIRPSARASTKDLLRAVESLFYTRVASGRPLGMYDCILKNFIYLPDLGDMQTRNHIASQVIQTLDQPGAPMLSELITRPKHVTFAETEKGNGNEGISSLTEARERAQQENQKRQNALPTITRKDLIKATPRAIQNIREHHTIFPYLTQAARALLVLDLLYQNGNECLEDSDLKDLDELYQQWLRYYVVSGENIELSLGQLDSIFGPRKQSRFSETQRFTDVTMNFSIAEADITKQSKTEQIRLNNKSNDDGKTGSSIIDSFVDEFDSRASSAVVIKGDTIIIRLRHFSHPDLKSLLDRNKKIRLLQFHISHCSSQVLDVGFRISSNVNDHQTSLVINYAETTETVSMDELESISREAAAKTVIDIQEGAGLIPPPTTTAAAETTKPQETELDEIADEDVVLISDVLRLFAVNPTAPSLSGDFYVIKKVYAAIGGETDLLHQSRIGENNSHLVNIPLGFLLSWEQRQKDSEQLRLECCQDPLRPPREQRRHFQLIQNPLWCMFVGNRDRAFFDALRLSPTTTTSRDRPKPVFLKRTLCTAIMFQSLSSIFEQLDIEVQRALARVRSNNIEMYEFPTEADYKRVMDVVAAETQLWNLADTEFHLKTLDGRDWSEVYLDEEARERANGREPGGLRFPQERSLTDDIAMSLNFQIHVWKYPTRREDDNVAKSSSTNGTMEGSLENGELYDKQTGGIRKRKKTDQDRADASSRIRLLDVDQVVDVDESDIFANDLLSPTEFVQQMKDRQFQIDKQRAHIPSTRFMSSGLTQPKEETEASKMNATMHPPKRRSRLVAFAQSLAKMIRPMTKDAAGLIDPAAKGKEI